MHVEFRLTCNRCGIKHEWRRGKDDAEAFHQCDLQQAKESGGKVTFDLMRQWSLCGLCFNEVVAFVEKRPEGPRK